MRGRVIAIAMILAACSTSAPSSPPPPPKNEVEAYERDRSDHKLFHGVYLAPSGIYVDRVLVSSVEDLPAKQQAVRARIAEAAEAPDAPLDAAPVMLDLDAAPLPVAVALLQALTGGQVELSLRRHPTADDPDRDPHRPMCRAVFDDKPMPADNTVRLSVLLTPNQIWLGLSRVNEFQPIPRFGDDLDWMKLEATLRGHRTSTFFADRDDFELAAEPGVTPAQLVTAIDIACSPRVDFSTIAILAPEQLSARPTR